MAERRMFSLKIINSARFLKLPIDAQNLYFHLGIRADDDGIVEAFPVMKLIGSSDDNLKLLHAKQFVIVLNEDLVTFITDWRVHNNIRADRKSDSIYKDLLIEILPEVPLLEPKERADRKKGRPMDDDWTSHGQSMDGIGKDRLGKDRLGKVNDIHVTSNEQLKDIQNKNKDEFLSEISNYTEDEELKNAILNYIQHRKDLKKPIKSTSTLKLIFKELEKHQDKIGVLNQSIVNGWQGIFEIKKTSTKNESTSSNIFDEIGKERGYW